MPKRLTILLAVILAVSGIWSRTRPLNFDNPGNRRLLKLESGNYYYYRSLPEKTMKLNVSGLDKIELRSFAIEPLRKPQVTVIIGGKKTTYDLGLDHRLDGYYMYAPTALALPKGTESIEILCYERSIYFRPFYTVIPKPKPKVTKPANLVLKAHGGIMALSHNGDSSNYYSFNPSQSLKFTLSNGRNAVIYVRARLLDRTLPMFELYQNGKLVGRHEFTLKRTTKYKVVGIDHLSIGLKIELPDNKGSSDYELRASSDHLFLAKPVLLKKK
jgi:hypothetical protein